MCQYQSTCPTTRHRPGTKCPERTRIENHNRKVDAQNRANLIGAIVVIGLIVVAGAVFWFSQR